MIPQLSFLVTCDDCLAVGLAAANDNWLRVAMSRQCLSDETPGSQQIALFSDEELDRVAQAVDGAVEIHPSTTNLHIGLIDMPFAGDGSLTIVEPFEQQW